VQAGDVDMLRRFVEDGIFLDRIRDYDGKSLVHIAAFECHNVVLEFLLSTSCVAQLNAPDRAGRTPLHLAAALGDGDGARILMRNGAFLNLRDEWGNTPMHLAAKHNQTESGILLIQGGADTKIRNNDGHYAFDLCEVPATLELFHAAKANYNDRKSLLRQPSRTAGNLSMMLDSPIVKFVDGTEEGEDKMEGVEIEENVSYRNITGFLLSYLFELEPEEHSTSKWNISDQPELNQATLSDVLPNFIDEDVVIDLSSSPESEIGVSFRWHGERYPVLVTHVTRGSIAKQFGIREGDKICKLNDAEIACSSAKHLIKLLKQRPLIIGIKRPASEVQITLHRRGPLGLELRWHPSDRLPVVTAVSDSGEAQAVGFLEEDQIRLVDEKRPDKDFANRTELIRTLQRTRPLKVKLVRWKNALGT
jgi:ankyrin repeat protein